MSEYFMYLGEMIKAVLRNLGKFFVTLFARPWIGSDGPFKGVGADFAEYNTYLQTYKGNFGFWGWFFFVLFAILLAAVIFGIGYVLFRLIRKYVRFVKKEIEKDDLRTEVEHLNYELYNAIVEKDKILNLKSTYMGLGNPADQKANQDVVEEVNSRFPKLVNVDHVYQGKDMSIEKVDRLSLEELCNRFRLFAASRLHLYYKIEPIRQLFAGMATSKLIILEGISGTGKTSLPYALGKFINFDASICAVQPSWKDRTELIGYYNEFTKKFNETEFLKSLYVSGYREDLNIIVLDEMNLARIEYYFAEFLSIMEMPNVNDWKIELIGTTTSSDPKHLNEGKLLIPQNVIFFGTANNDDSTFTISDKVYDRAISLFFDDKGIPFDAEDTESLKFPYSQLDALYAKAKQEFPVSGGVLAKFDELDTFVIKKFKLAFGNRILKQMKDFIPVYVACGGSELDGLDFIFTNKILKKFQSLNIGFLKDELRDLENMLDKLYGKNTFKMAHAFIQNLIRMN
ncbi:MAG: hypothetical protein MJZ37_04185 [Bacilli bacterium]|nr:hypothetical protein [Bacilli bacterium]